MKPRRHYTPRHERIGKWFAWTAAIGVALHLAHALIMYIIEITKLPPMN